MGVTRVQRWVRGAGTLRIGPLGRCEMTRHGEFGLFLCIYRLRHLRLRWSLDVLSRLRTTTCESPLDRRLGWDGRVHIGRVTPSRAEERNGVRGLLGEAWCHHDR